MRFLKVTTAPISTMASTPAMVGPTNDIKVGPSWSRAGATGAVGAGFDDGGLSDGVDGLVHLLAQQSRFGRERRLSRHRADAGDGHEQQQQSREAELRSSHVGTQIYSEVCFRLQVVQLLHERGGIRAD
ncbi:hypothetical protein GQ600_24300 [Phytophthora cactorum]|nr:hypothetical protein GQ600_24300 [Phytophthora cactorum]